jgi:hypothetical protein
MWRQVRVALLACLLAPFVLSSQEFTKGFPTDRGHGEGKMWLLWDASERVGFVRGYVWGLDRGYRNGCMAYDKASHGSGVETLDLSKPVNLLKNHLSECVSRRSDFSKEPTYYESQLTKFYETYPQDQDLPIRQLFAQMEDSSNLTLEQIHTWYHTP